MAQTRAPKAPAPAPAENGETPQRQYASADRLPLTGWAPVHLPLLNAWVRVRHLDTPEITRLQFLPQLQGFGDLMARKLADAGMNRAQKRAAKKRGDNVPTAGEVAAENYRFQSWVVHVAVLAQDDRPDETYEIPEPKACRYCVDEDGSKEEHPPSLWTPEQTAKIQPVDLDAIMSVAMSVRQVEGLLPFSGPKSQNGSEPPAVSGESIRPTN